MRWRAAGVVLVLGAAVYALLVGVGDVPFPATPLIVALSAGAAGLVSGQVRLVVIGLALGGWGAAVLLVDRGVTPDGRTAATYTLGLALGLGAAWVAARRTGTGFGGALCTASFAGLSAYLAPDVDALGEWPAWAVLLVTWGLLEGLRPPRRAA